MMERVIIFFFMIIKFQQALESDNDTNLDIIENIIAQEKVEEKDE